MQPDLLRDAFGHHVWATLRVIEACRALSDEQLSSAVPGTYGSILDTLRHTVGADSWYLSRLSGGRYEPIEEEGMSLGELREAMERNGHGWTDVLETGIDPEEVLVVRRDDGSETHATKGIRVAQVVHHGTDHRSQVCTALTALGIEPPLIDVWDYGAEIGRVTQTPPTA